MWDTVSRIKGDTDNMDPKFHFSREPKAGYIQRG